MINIIRQEINRLLKSLTYFALGEITEINWQNQTASVRLNSGARTTARIAALSTLSLFPLRPGDEVLLCFPDGSIHSSAIIFCPLYGATPVPSSPENAFYLTQKNKKFLFDAQGNIICEVKNLDITAEKIELNSSQVTIAQGEATAVRYEELLSALNTFISLLATHTHICNAVGSFSGPPVPTPTIDITLAKARKTRLT